jgi:hypothetical protein
MLGFMFKPNLLLNYPNKTQMKRPNPLEKYVLKYPRAYGAILIAIGIGLFFWMIVSPLKDAEAGVSEIIISQKGVVVAEICLIIGLPSLAFGSHFVNRIPLSAEQPKTGVFYAIVAVGAIAAITTYHALKTTLEAKGYIFR